jgi:hypothetical protein
VSYRLASGPANDLLTNMMDDGVLVAAVEVERQGDPVAPVVVRPPAWDPGGGWMPSLEEAIGFRTGTVAFSGADMVETAALAAEAAAWLGDRGIDVVLVDASVERPLVRKPLPDDGDEGLVDAVLFGVTHARVTRRTLTPGVTVVTAGSYPLSVDSVFEGEGLGRLLSELSDERLVVLLVAPVHLAKVRGALSAVVCVGKAPADLGSVSACSADVRSIGLMVRPPQPAVTQTIPEEPVTASQEAEQVDVEPEPPAAVIEAQRAPTAEVATPRTPPARTARRTAGPVLVVSTLVVLVAVWWFVDGRTRFGTAERAGPTSVTQMPAERRDAAADRAAEESGEPRGEVADHERGEVEAGGTGTVGAEEAAQEGSGAPEPASDTARETPEVTGEIRGPGGRYVVLISSHYRESLARAEAAELEARGVATEVVAADLGERGTWYRVAVSGGYPSLSGARSVLDTIKSFGYEGAWVERAPLNSEE